MRAGSCAAVLSLVAACSATAGPADVDAYTGPPATLTGKVWAPHQGPGQAVLGQEIPVAGALVYVTATRPEPISDHVYCEQCVATPSGGVLTGPDGSFELAVLPGRYYVVIQKGQFRSEAEYEVGLGTLALTSEQTTLPSQWDPPNGLFMPRMAMARGTHDTIEDVLAKFGIGTLTGNSFTSPVGEHGPELEIYDYAGTGAASVTFLLSNLDEMRKFHIIYFPCASTMSELDALLSNQTVLGNIRRYVHEGGKLYVTDWSGELADRAFPKQLELGDPGADSDGTYDPITFAGTLTTVGGADGARYEVSDGKALDPDLNAWLGLQMGPTEMSPTPALYNANLFAVTDLWNWVKKLNSVQLGLDAMGLPVYDQPRTWVTGSKSGTASATGRPIAVTYQPTGCGKVLYTPFQTASGAHAGLYPQERVLLYLIMEITTCSDSPIL